MRPKLLSLFLFLAGTAGFASASTVTWTLDNVTFGILNDPNSPADGGSASGSFQFNTASDTITSWSIVTTTTGAPFGGYDYTPDDSTIDFINNTDFAFLSLDNQHQFYFTPVASPGLASASPVSITPQTFATAEYDFAIHPAVHTYRYALTGTLDPSAGSSTPEPSTVFLAMSGLLGIPVFARRRGIREYQRLMRQSRELLSGRVFDAQLHPAGQRRRPVLQKHDAPCLGERQPGFDGSLVIGQ